MKAARRIAIVFLLFLGLSAFVGSVPMIVDPGGTFIRMPLTLLEHSPFHSFLIPGLILFFCNGVLSLAIAIAVLRTTKNCGGWVSFQGCVIFGWITVQVIMLRQLYWLHFVYWGIGLLLMACGWILHKQMRAAAAPALHA